MVSDSGGVEIPTEIPNVGKKTATDLFVEKTDAFFEKRVDPVFRAVSSSPERMGELLSAQILMGIEILHDMQLYPTKYGTTPDQVGQYLVPESPPAAKWAMDHIGDIWEISAGHTAMRLGFVVLNEALKTDKAKGAQKKLLKSEGAQKLVGRFVGEERTGELAQGAEIQISDDVAFWTSLITVVTAKAMHSLGYISSSWLTLGDMPIGQWHDHVGNPVPEMIFGQVVAAIALAATHYTVKHRASIKDLAIRVGGVGKRAVEGATSFGRKLDAFDLADWMASGRVNAAFGRLQKRTDAFLAKVENWDPAASLPTPEAIVQSLLGERVSKARANLEIEHDTDNLEREESY